MDDALHSHSLAEELTNRFRIDVTECGVEFGFRTPIAISLAAWVKCVSVPDCGIYEGIGGRIYHILSVLRCAIRVENELSEMFFTVRVEIPSNIEQLVRLKAVFSADEGQPVITIMLPNED